MGVPLSIPGLTGWGAFVMLTWVIIRAFVKGDVRTDREFQELRADRDARLKEAAEWQTAHAKEIAAHEETRRQVTALLPVGQITAKVMRSLPVDVNQEGQP
ncbi:hypothetical protein V2J56_09240 [Georgenia sp. MJ206]|uniref:hypothetical protein n=1 Tax=Georgenia wangjunii TaxID=3117730 RepID=UPI002F26454B